jgi:hypothetical protein
MEPEHVRHLTLLRTFRSRFHIAGLNLLTFEEWCLLGCYAVWLL